MSFFDNLDDWSDKHHPKLLDLVRILLGVVIFLKGLYFVSHTEELQSMFRGSFPWGTVFIAHYIAMAHLAGGVLIAIGCVTRVAIALQLPILLGAVIFVNAPKGFYTPGSDLALSLIVLLLLVFYFFYGSGYLSVDHSLQKKKDKQPA